MKHILFFLFAMCVTIAGCSPPKRAVSLVVTQGITGRITELSGNQMPMKGAPPAVPVPLKTTVLVYEPTHLNQATQSPSANLYTAIYTKLVASVNTDSAGIFTIALPVGSYSVFVKLDNGFYANLFDTKNNIALFTVEQERLTKVNLIVSRRASF